MAGPGRPGGRRRRGGALSRGARGAGGEGEGRRGLQRLWGVARLVLAGAILVWVARSLPWRDRLEIRSAADPGVVLQVEGRIVGDWKADEVAFRPAPELEGDVPEAVREAALTGKALRVRRSAEGEPGYDWQPGMPRVFASMEPAGLALALGLFLLGNLTIVTRWWKLLALAGCPTPWWQALRLTFMGLFFNTVMPGQTGGDLVKGILAAREHPERRADALVSVLVDRVFGLLALAVLAVVVILAVGGPFVVLRKGLLLLLGGVVLGVALYANKPLRKRVGLSALVDRLPIGEKLRKLDRAALLYLRHPGAVAVAFLFSFLNHLCVVLAVFFLGGALGVPRVEVGLLDYLVLVPVANIVAAIPLAPGGWGLGELVYRELFELIGASAALGVAVSVTFRLSQLVMGLLGSPFLLVSSSRALVRDAEAQARPGPAAE